MSLTSADLRAAALKRWAPPEWLHVHEALIPEDKGHKARRADLITVNTFPSRGYVIRGYELKISRADWQRELRDPHKADDLARWVDSYALITAPGVLQAGELPDGWGHYELTGRGLMERVPPRTGEERGDIPRWLLVHLLRPLAGREQSAHKTLLQRAYAEGREEGQRATRQSLEMREEAVREQSELIQQTFSLLGVHPWEVRAAHQQLLKLASGAGDDHLRQRSEELRRSARQLTEVADNLAGLADHYAGHPGPPTRTDRQLEPSQPEESAADA